jgi:hypothetical protein
MEISPDPVNLRTKTLLRLRGSLPYPWAVEHVDESICLGYQGASLYHIQSRACAFIVWRGLPLYKAHSVVTHS